MPQRHFYVANNEISNAMLLSYKNAYFMVIYIRLVVIELNAFLFIVDEYIIVQKDECFVAESNVKI